MRPAIDHLDKDSQVELLTASMNLISKTDDSIENAKQNHLDMDEVLPSLLELLKNSVKSDMAFLAIKDAESNTIIWTASGSDNDLLEPVLSEVHSFADGNFAGDVPDLSPFVIQVLDINGGKNIGVAGFRPAQPVSFEDLAPAHYILHCFCEEVDNYVFNEIFNRKTHLVQIAIGRALKHRIFSQALIEALTLLKENIDFNTLIMALSL